MANTTGKREASRYHIAAVARMTGLTADTIRAWERRYALVKPARDPAGVRNYAAADVARLALARAATQRGHPIRHVAALSDGKLAALTADERRETGVAKTQRTTADDLVADVLHGVRKYDGERVKTLLGSAALFLTGEELVLRVLAPLMHAVGELWEAKRLSIAQEHLISGLVRDVVGSLTRLRLAAGEPSMLFATPPGEPHEFGIALAACLASLRGIRNCVLGPNVPAQELLRAARFVGPTIVVIGTLLSDAPAELERYLISLEAALPRRTELWVGGSGVPGKRPDRWPKRVQTVATLDDFAERLTASARR